MDHALAPLHMSSSISIYWSIDDQTLCIHMWLQAGDRAKALQATLLVTWLYCIMLSDTTQVDTRMTLDE